MPNSDGNGRHAAATLPNPGRAVVEIEKLRDYCLNRNHPRGRHKARVFASALGITADRAEELRAALLEAAREVTATLVDEDEYGRRYFVDGVINGPGGSARVRGCWIVRRGEDFPRLTSCYVLRAGDGGTEE